MKTIFIAVLVLLSVGLDIAYGKAEISPYTQYGCVVERVIDGDTVAVNCEVYPNQFLKTSVRLRGVNAPETLKQFAECEEEIVMGRIVTQFVTEMLPVGTEVVVGNIGLDKFGRLLGNIQELDNWRSLKYILLDKGYVKDYIDGKKVSWCEDVIEEGSAKVAN